jgi:hypothetical protein
MFAYTYSVFLFCKKTKDMTDGLQAFNGEPYMQQRREEAAGASSYAPVTDGRVIQACDNLVRNYQETAIQLLDDLEREGLGPDTRVIIPGDVPLEEIATILQNRISSQDEPDDKPPWRGGSEELHAKYNQDKLPVLRAQINKLKNKVLTVPEKKKRAQYIDLVVNIGIFHNDKQIVEKYMNIYEQYANLMPTFPKELIPSLRAYAATHNWLPIRLLRGLMKTPPRTPKQAAPKPVAPKRVKPIPQALSDLLNEVKRFQILFTGDGITKPFVTKHNKSSDTTEFEILTKFGDVVELRNNLTDETHWALTRKSHFVKDNVIFVWIDKKDGAVRSGEFKLKSGLYVQVPSYFCKFVAKGSFGQVWRIDIMYYTGQTKKYAVKYFVPGKDSTYAEELFSSLAIIDALKYKKRDIQEAFGNEACGIISGCMCVLDQKSKEVLPIQQFVNNSQLFSSKKKPNSLILKTIDDEVSFRREGLDPVKMNLFVKRIILVGLFLLTFIPRLTYTDWKIDNIIWNNDNIMLIDILISDVFFHTPYIYEKNPRRLDQSGFAFPSEIVLDQTRQTKARRVLSLFGLHNACVELMIRTNRSVTNARGQRVRSMNYEPLRGSIISLLYEEIKPYSTASPGGRRQITGKIADVDGILLTRKLFGQRTGGKKPTKKRGMKIKKTLVKK